MKKQLITVAAVAALTMFAACGGSKTQGGAGADSTETVENANTDAGIQKETPMAELADKQLKAVEIMENSLGAAADQAKYKVFFAKYEKMKKEEETVAKGLQGKPFTFTASEASGLQVKNGRIDKVNTIVSSAMCCCWFEADVTGVADGAKVPCFMIDNNGVIIGKQESKKVSGGTMRVGFEYRVNIDTKEIIKACGRLSNIVIVSPEEFKANKILK